MSRKSEGQRGEAGHILMRSRATCENSLRGTGTGRRGVLPLLSFTLFDLSGDPMLLTKAQSHGAELDC